MLGFGPNSANAQSLLCPWPAANPGDPSVPLSADWKTNLPIGPKIIPVVVHLIGGSSSGLTQAQVVTALSQLNADFNSVNLDWDIEFRLARFSPDGECTNGITDHPELGPFGNFKSLTRWPNANYFNIWVVDAVNGDPQILGAVSALPTLFKENATCDGVDRTDRIAGQNASFDGEDGVVIKKDEFYPNNAGRHTLAHEAGHWLNLHHVHERDPISNTCPYWTNCHPESESATNGDFIEDTNPQEEVNTFNPLDCSNIGIGKCSNVPLLANLDNFMGYAHPCQNTFMQGQREWMFACLQLNRAILWSAENLRCTGVISAPNNISGHIVWDIITVPTGFIQVPNEIHILHNSSLTIASDITVQFCENAKLVVDAGGHLILNGKLTNTCYGKMWKGVEVQGSAASNTQWPNNNGVYSQGRLTAGEGSVIENAVTGILVGNVGGGIVKCTGTTFHNNRTSVIFQQFENHIPSQCAPPPCAPVTSNSSHFSNCDFINDIGYLGDNLAIYDPSEQLKFYAFADLTGIRGIRFLGCDFRNLRTDLVSPYDYGYGIIATESGFIVNNFCTATSPSPAPCQAGNQVKCTFKNLSHGIFVGQTDISGVLPKFYSVQLALFEGCWIGVRSEAASRGIIVQNTFKIGDVPVAGYVPNIFGVLLESGHTTFSLQENNFELAQNVLPDVLATMQLIGSRAYHIGETDNLIHKNYYKNLTMGNESVGDNSSNFLGSTGLLYLCNENENNSPYDFNVRSGNGVRGMQGIPTGAPPFVTFDPAGNFFSHVNLLESDFRNDAGNAISYFHNLTVPETPQTFTANKVTPNPKPVARQCESVYCDPPCRSQAELDLEKQAVLNAKSQYNTVYADYIQQPNGPNAASQKNSMTALQATMQENTFDVLLHIIANEGSLADYRFWLGNLDAYETDLELAKGYLGAGEFAQSSSLLNGMVAKHGLIGEKLTTFNDYRAVLNVMQAHLQNGGDKYNLSTVDINTLKGYAENNSSARVRGQAKAMLLMYGILYPPEEAIETGGRDDTQAQSTADAFSLSPNPADQSVWVQFPNASNKSDLTGQVNLYSVHGRLLFQREVQPYEGGLNIPLIGQPEGCYFLQVRLSNGMFTTLPLIIAH